jgi:hypothetical protein
MLSISFTRDEWAAVLMACLDVYDEERLGEYDYMLLNIVDRIEKEMGIE